MNDKSQKSAKEARKEQALKFMQILPKADKYKPEKVKEKISIEQELARRELLKNQELEQDRKLKKLSLILLFIFLAAETVAIFWLAYLQAIQDNNFQMAEWSFNLLIGATITQITLMLQFAIKYLFSKKESAGGKN